MGFPGSASGKESACQCRRHGFNPLVRKILWRRAWQPTLVFVPGESHGQKSLAGYSPWGSKESDTRVTRHYFTRKYSQDTYYTQVKILKLRKKNDFLPLKNVIITI